MAGQSQHRLAEIVAATSEIFRALSICAPAALLGAPAALAQATELQRLTADIPAQPLGQALAILARQTHLKLFYVSDVVREQRSHAVPAGLSAHEALARMLDGTGLKYEPLTPRSVRILAAVAGPQASVMPAATAEQLQELIITADRREENLQNVPSTVQVLTGEMLANLQATTFDDFVGYLPAVTAHGLGPSQSTLYIRGLGTGEYSNQTAGSNGSLPNVAIYLDEQSAQLPGRNLDIYAADLDRIEVLEGPQGTLFGAGAQAGVLRYITNKPKLSLTEASVSAGYAATVHGDPSSTLEAVINIPLVPDRLAARAVIYDEKRGGYIDNIPATFVRANSDLSIRYAGGAVPTDSEVINNAPVATNKFNPLTYSGLRAEISYQSEDWSALLAQSYQNMKADGVFTEAATDSFGRPQPDLSVQLYNPSYDKDRFENTALTIEGRLAALKLLYASAYLVRHVEQVQDYTNYAHSGTYVDYYQCVNPGPTPAATKCFTPSSTWRDVERNSHLTQELRVSTPDDWRVRGVGGLFYDLYKIQEQTDWYYLTALPYFEPIGPPTGYFLYQGRQVCFCQPGSVLVPGPPTLNNPDVRPLGDAFFNDITRSYRQKAAYASVDVDLLPRVLTLTGGTRYFDTNATETGVVVSSTGCELAAGPPDPCINHSGFLDLNEEKLDRTYAGFRSRGTLSFKPTQEVLFYYTWSQGFRPGGFNRSFEVPLSSPLAYVSHPQAWQIQAHQHGGWTLPLGYEPDLLTNNELGWKSMWLGERLQWNGALYEEDWKAAQVDAFAGSILSDSTINGGNYRARGIETFARARVSDLTLQAGVAWNHSELVKEAAFFWADGKPIDFSSLQTSTGQRLANPAGTIGSSLAGAPTFQGNLRARYEFAFDRYHGFVQFGVMHQSGSLSTTDRISLDLQGKSIAYDLPAFTSYDAAVGLGSGGWLVQAYGANLSDTRAQLFANYGLGYKAVTVNRPRTVGLRFSYKVAY